MLTLVGVMSEAMAKHLASGILVCVVALKSEMFYNKLRDECLCEDGDDLTVLLWQRLREIFQADSDTVLRVMDAL